MRRAQAAEAAHVRGHDGQPRRPRLQHDDAERLVPARQREDVRGAVFGRELRAPRRQRAGDGEPVLRAQLRRSGAQRLEVVRLRRRPHEPDR